MTTKSVAIVTGASQGIGRATARIRRGPARVWPLLIRRVRITDLWPV